MAFWFSRSARGAVSFLLRRRGSDGFYGWPGTGICAVGSATPSDTQRHQHSAQYSPVTATPSLRSRTDSCSETEANRPYGSRVRQYPFSLSCMPAFHKPIRKAQAPMSNAPRIGRACCRDPAAWSRWSYCASASLPRAACCAGRPVAFLPQKLHFRLRTTFRPPRSLYCRAGRFLPAIGNGLYFT